MLSPSAGQSTKGLLYDTKYKSIFPEEEFANKLFSENLGIVIEANKKDKAVIQKTLETNNIPYDIIGQTVKEKTITVNKKISLKIKEIKNDWEGSLREKLLS